MGHGEDATLGYDLGCGVRGICRVFRYRGCVWERWRVCLCPGLGWRDWCRPPRGAREAVAVSVLESNKALRFIGLTRKSSGEDEGTHGDQRRIIESRVEAEGFTLLRVDREQKVSGAKDWRTREIGRAVKDVRAGEADGIIVAYQDRITRERLRAAAEIWEALEDAGAVFIACDGVDSRAPGSELLFTIKAAIAREQWKTYQARSNDGRKRVVVEEGVHGGDIAPFGYSWTERVKPDGTVRHGPLTPNDDAPKVLAAFEARAAGATWSEVAWILTVRSKSAAAKVLCNRVYVGEARSGQYVRPNAHQPLVDEVLFSRVQRRQEAAIRDTSKRETLLSRVLKCCTCGGTLTWDGSMAKPGYRCKHLHCARKVTVAAWKIEPVVLDLALGWHRVTQPWFALTREVEDAMLPALMDALEAAQAEVESLREQIHSGAVSPSAGAVALTAAEKAVEDARERIESAEAGTGWLSLTPERVAEKLDGADVVTRRSFIREMGTVIVYPVGRGHGNAPVTSRIRWQANTPVVDYAALPERVLEADTQAFLAACAAYRAAATAKTTSSTRTTSR
jgi:DNA invertase Pin-like site-specific DNA recombinase